MIDNGNRKVSLFVKELDIVELKIVGKDTEQFLNINSKEDLRFIV